MRIFIAMLVAALFGSQSTNAQEMPIRTVNKVVASEQRAMILSFFQLNPDCTPVGPLTVRIKKQPASGKLEHASGQTHSTFPPEHPRFKCNEKMSEGMLFHYTSNPGFTGVDQFDVEIITSVGTSAPARVRITVK